MAQVNNSAKTCAVVEPLESRTLLSTVSFKDSFSPAPSPLWSNSVGNWAASGGTYFAKNPSNTTGVFSGLPYVVTDCTVSVRVNAIGDGGIFLHTDDTRSNFILLVVGGDGYGQGARGGVAGTALYWHIITNGSATPPQDEVDNVFVPGSTHTITVTIKGNVYSAFVDNSTKAATTLVSSARPTGKIGLYDDQPNKPAGGSGTPTTFSNFSLAGTATAVTIAGHVFNDFNGSGKIETGEGGIPGVKVFIDTNHNGKLDSGEPVTTTAANGSYTFANIAPGAYSIREIVPAGLVATSPLNGSAVNVFANVSNINFGVAAPVSISGTVFSDANGDGLMDGTDKGLSGFKVFIDLANTGVLTSTDPVATTSTSGAFTITGLRPGTYKIQIVAQSGLTATTPTAYALVTIGGTSIAGIHFGEHKIV